MRQLLFAIVSALSITSAYGYRFTQDFDINTGGFYWRSFPVAMTVIDSDANRLNLLKRLADEAVVTWENVVITTANLWTMSAQQAGSLRGNTIRWSNNFSAETGLDSSSILAVTIRYTGGPYISKTEIIINGNNPINNSETNLRTVILHEMGHTLGLDHSEFSNAVMAPNLIFGFNGLHSDDRAGIAAVASETLRRQATSYISPLSAQETTESESPLSCGTVDLGQGGGGSGPGNGLFSLALGLMLALIASAKGLKKRT